MTVLGDGLGWALNDSVEEDDVGCRGLEGKQLTCVGTYSLVRQKVKLDDCAVGEL